MLTFDPDSQFNMNSIKKLDGVGVPVLSPLTQALEDKRLLQALEMVEEYRSLEDMIRFWVNGKGSLPGTWRAMIDVLRDLDYQKESQEIKDYLWSEWINVYSYSAHIIRTVSDIILHAVLIRLCEIILRIIGSRKQEE